MRAAHFVQVVEAPMMDEVKALRECMQGPQRPRRIRISGELGHYPLDLEVKLQVAEYVSLMPRRLDGFRHIPQILTFAFKRVLGRPYRYDFLERAAGFHHRSEERRVGEECASRGRSRWAP